MRSIFAPCAVLLMGVVVASCGERAEVFYADAGAARRDGAVERGWIPEWLPKSAREIHELHDIDTNQILLAFSFDPVDRPGLAPSCSQVRPDALRPVAFRASWWPSDVPPSSFVTPRHAYYQCKSGGYVAVSDGQLYYWRP